MKLTLQQIEEIKAFILHKGYLEPDLQIEILDHVACLVEEKIHEDLGFHEALNLTYQNLGSWGLREFVKYIEEGYLKAQVQTIKSTLRNWFLSPYTFVFLLLSILIYSAILKYFEPIVVGLPALFLLLYITYYFAKIQHLKKLYCNYIAVESIDRFNFLKILTAVNLSGLLLFAEPSPLWAFLYTLGFIIMVLVFTIHIILLETAFKNCSKLACLYN